MGTSPSIATHRFGSRRAAYAALMVTPLTFARSVLAFEAGSVDETPVVVDVTATSSVVYNADNRNTRAADVTRRADDDWGAWYNRVNVQSHWGNWQVGVRMETAWFYTSPSPQRIGLDLLALEHGGSLPATFTPEDAEFFQQKFFQAGDELSNRYVNWMYPAKYYVGYKHEHADVILGDFTAQFGQGLVLSVRKIDELANDTSIRGARITSQLRADDWRFRFTALGGALNPLRIDDASGRYLAVGEPERPDFLAVTEAGMPWPVDTDFVRGSGSTYAPDRIVGTQLEGGPQFIKLGVQGSWLLRQAPLSGDIVRNASDIGTGSVSLSLPDLWQQGAAYIEVAAQHLQSSRAESSNVGGHAVYGSINWTPSPVTVTGELKHYRRFFPLLANVDLTRAREFQTVQYSKPPTTEPIWNDTQFEGFNTCVTGGRVKTDVAVGQDESVYAWVGHYWTWAESISNELCNTADENLNRVWDFATGFEITANERRSRVDAMVGTRFDETARALPVAGGETNIFYREVYARYDWIQWLNGPFSLQFQGWLRRRHQTFGGPDLPWHQGITINELKWGSHLAAGVGLEFDENPAFPDVYVNGQVRYNIDSGSSLVLFVGQRQGGLRCVSGVCRIFPPFEGARLDATFRF